ncbi:MAG: hypothetical protein JOZ10_04700 [Acidobacteria bacterium]|nr:hypothetical protein [Acidobacteriota bacterium]MBV9145611.1 hypothetical protein [Acidobacteriota bacterium]
MVNVSRKKDWEPSESAFRGLLNWLDAGEDSDGRRYLDIRRRLVLYFERKNCLASQELADETLNRVARRLEEQGCIRDAAPAQYCYIVARFVFLESLREPEAQSRALSDESASSPPGQRARSSDDDRSSKEMLQALEECLTTLAPSDRELMLEYYRGERQEKIRGRKALAGRLGVTLNALTIRACRLRDKLEACVRRRLGES